jgi:hypothetical protein
VKDVVKDKDVVSRMHMEVQERHDSEKHNRASFRNMTMFEIAVSWKS